MFGLGCFWGAERKFWELGDGVYVTAVGYAGGSTPNPTYDEVCSGRTGHNEVVLVVYDPKKISYERLLKTFWESHDPTQGMRQGNDVGTQYRSGIYVFTPEQRAAAEASKAAYAKALAAARMGPITTEIRRRAAVLFRRGLSPAISGEESARLLRPRRYRRELPDRYGRRRVTPSNTGADGDRRWPLPHVSPFRYSPFAASCAIEPADSFAGGIMRPIGRAFQRLIFVSRWLAAPFLLGLIAGLVLLLYRFFADLFRAGGARSPARAGTTSSSACSTWSI